MVATVDVLPVSYSVSDDDTGIWREALASKKTNPNQGSTVVILGDHGCGKSSLLNQLDKDSKPRHESLLEYRVLNVQNNARDSSYAYQLGATGSNSNPSEILNIPVWTLHGDDSCADLLKHTFPQDPSKIIFILTGTIDNPNLIDSLKRWANVCTTQVQKHFTKENLKLGKSQQEKMWQEYVDPIESQMSTSYAGNFSDEHYLLALDQGTLSENCGVTFNVVITKSDLGKNHTEQHFAEIMVQLRQFCLALGATLVFTSSKDSKNIQLFQKYILHQSFAMPFTNTAQVIEREGIFVPAGWDGDQKIDIIRKMNPGIESVSGSIRDKETQQSKEALIEAENDQEFLNKLIETLSTSNESTEPARQVVPEEAAENSPLARFFSNLLQDHPQNHQ